MDFRLTAEEETVRRESDDCIEREVPILYRGEGAEGNPKFPKWAWSA